MAPPVTKNVVAHDCEKGGRVRPVQGLKLDPGPERKKTEYPQNSRFSSSIIAWTAGGW